MKLYFREFDCYKNVDEATRESAYYTPDCYFDLARLPTLGLQNEFAPFLMERGRQLTVKSFYIDYRSFAHVSDFLSECHETLESLLLLGDCTKELSDWLSTKGISPTRKANSNKGYVYHPAVYYLQKAITFVKHTEYIFFSDLDCYKAVPKEKQNNPNYHPDYKFDLSDIPNPLRTELRDFIFARGKELTYTSITAEKLGFSYVAPFLLDANITTIKGINREEVMRKLRKYLLKHQLPVSYTRKRKTSDVIESKAHPSITYLNRLIDFYIPDDGLFHFESDIWQLDRLDFPISNAPTNPTLTLNFSGIETEQIKKEVKMSCLYRLRLKKASTIVAEIFAVSQFADFINVNSLTEVNREILEDYLTYLYTECGRRKNYNTELKHLKSVLEMIGHLTHKPQLQHLFVADDFQKNILPVYRFYTDKELATLNAGFKTLDAQTGRLMILHEILGCRISETLTLTSDCVELSDTGEYFIRINEEKVYREYKKPISADVKKLIDASIAYTKSLYGECDYIFVSDKDPMKPMSYSTLYYRVISMIRELDLRDEQGNLFTIGTHTFRRTYGKKLCDLGLDDSVIAKLLGHSSTDSVKHYRRMSNQVLAKETKLLRAQKDAQINKYKGAWE